VTKITHRDYFLPTIQALSGDTVFGHGTTKPMLVRGVCTTTGEKSDYVVKYKKSPRMSTRSSCRELIAAFIAKEVDLHVADPVLIDITPEFVETLVGKDGYKFAYNSVGLNFGCKYFTGYWEFIRRQPLNDWQRKEAEKIYAFDLFIANPDRRLDKQNMLTDGEKILIFDHELAFSFVMDIVKNPTPWIIGAADLPWIKNHYFYNVLRQSAYNFDAFVEGFNVLNENFWSKVNVLIPREWVTSQVSEIQNNMELLVKNRHQFLEHLYKSLS
jgi:hypothetical protein